MLISIGRENDKVNFIATEVSSIEELCEVITESPYSFGTYKNNYRNVENFIQTKAIGLDVDEGLSLKDAIEMFKDYRHIISTSRNHQKDKVTKSGTIKPACDRFRVILFLSQPITDVETAYSTWFAVANKFETKFKFDASCKDPSRFWFASKEIVSCSLDGLLIDPVAPVIPLEPQTKKSLEPGQKGELSKETLKFLLQGALPGTRHHALYKASRDAHQQGYTQEEFIEKIKNMVAITGDQDFLNESSMECIKDAFTKEAKHDPRIEEKAFKLLKIGQLYQDKTEIEWVVDDLLSKGGVSLISADPKAGKSTIVRQLIRDVLRGGKFLERKCVKGTVLYFAIEEQVQVVNKSFKRLGVNEEDSLLVHLGDPLTDSTLKDFEDLIIEHKPVLCVIDTLFDFLEVESENNYKEVKRELRRLRKIARASGTHIVLVHHSSKPAKDDRRRGNRGILGSQAIAGGVDTIIVIEVDGEDRLITTTGREIKRWVFRDIIYNPNDGTYSLGVEMGNYGQKSYKEQY